MHNKVDACRDRGIDHKLEPLHNSLSFYLKGGGGGGGAGGNPKLVHPNKKNTV